MNRSLLENGMTLLTERLPGFHGASIGVWVQAGSRHESDAESGLSHFLEHMMFKGTETRSAFEIARIMDQAGGEFNAFTSREYTCFQITLLAKDMGLAVEILADVLLNSTFHEDEIARERKVVMQEMDMVNDSPEEVLYDSFFESALGGHRLGRPILGTKASIRGATRPRVVNYFKKHYDPSRMIVSATGDIDHSRLKTMLNRAFKGAHFVKGSKLSNLSSPRHHAGVRYVKRDTEQMQLLVGFPSMSVVDDDRYTASVLNVHLGGGMSSRLFQEIREKRGLAYSVYSSQSLFSDCGLFTVYAGTAPRDAQKCLDIMGTELATLCQKPLSETEMQDLKTNLKNTILLNEDSVEGRMMQLARAQMFFGRDISLKEVFKYVDAVTAADVQRLARETFNPKKLYLAAIGPKQSAGVGKKLHKALVDKIIA